MVRARKGTYLDVFTAAARAGVSEAVVDGALVSTDAPPRLRKTKEHDIDLVLWTGRASALPREAFEQALRWGKGLARLVSEGRETLLSAAHSCPAVRHGRPGAGPALLLLQHQAGGL